MSGGRKLDEISSGTCLVGDVGFSAVEISVPAIKVLMYLATTTN